MTKWQPMETAPKDGTRILILDPEDDAYPIEIVSWYDGRYKGYWENLGGRSFEPIGWIKLPPATLEEKK